MNDRELSLLLFAAINCMDGCGAYELEGFGIPEYMVDEIFEARDKALSLLAAGRYRASAYEKLIRKEN